MRYVAHDGRADGVRTIEASWRSIALRNWQMPTWRKSTWEAVFQRVSGRCFRSRLALRGVELRKNTKV